MIKSFTFPYLLSFPKFHYKIQGRPVLYTNTIFCVIVILWYVLFYYTLSYMHAVFFWRRYTAHMHNYYIRSARIHTIRAGLSIIVSQFYCSTVPPNKRTFLQRGNGIRAQRENEKEIWKTKGPAPGFLVNLRGDAGRYN